MTTTRTRRKTRPIDQAQQRLVSAILRGQYPPGAALLGERALASELGVTRPTLREVLRRLESSGWLTIQHGKSTVVTDYWREGGLNVLGDIVRYSETLPHDFVANLLQIRLDLAPSYTRLALQNDPAAVIDQLAGHAALADTPAAYAAFDWALHHLLTVVSGNPIYAMILNGFADFYVPLAEKLYFPLPQARASSAAFYADLLHCARSGAVDDAAVITRRVMALSIDLWQQAAAQSITPSPMDTETKRR
ncbi:MAG: GntR family transcriptional regulator [Chloroflexota bacterium]